MIVTHSQLTEVTWMVLIEHNTSVVLTTSFSLSSKMLSVFPNTTITMLTIAVALLMFS
jgi:hypothetical protein